LCLLPLEAHISTYNHAASSIEHGGPALQVAPDLWRITTPLPFPPRSVHAYLARLAGGGFLLVDGGLGSEAAWEALQNGVRAVAGGWERIQVHLLTHMHMDHIGLAARVREESGAPVLTGRLDAERMAHAAADPADEARYRAELLRRCGAPVAWVAAQEQGREQAQPLAPAVRVEEGLDGERGDLPGAEGWEFLWTPGHTAGHLSLYRAGDAVLVAGDAVLPRITPTLGVNRQRSDPVGDYLAALERLQALGPLQVLPGHGDPLADGQPRIRELHAAARQETEAVAGLLDAEGATAWQVVERRYLGRELPVSTRMLALRETLAHLERARGAGRIQAETDAEGAERFRAG
jgi:glyoxylase-like metal-dependent hydrolase (beta-lactamase superfamily II)